MSGEELFSVEETDHRGLVTISKTQGRIPKRQHTGEGGGGGVAAEVNINKQELSPTRKTRTRLNKSPVQDEINGHKLPSHRGSGRRCMFKKLNIPTRQ